MELLNKVSAAAVLSVAMTGVSVEAATYEVTFDAVWSAATHPNDIPGNPHFSPLVGGVHNAGVTFWETGGIASDGVEVMAESGAPTMLKGEVDAAVTAGTAGMSIVADGPVFSPGSKTVTFEATDTHSLLTLVTMIAPSPDWFLGVNSLDLKDGGGDWRTEIIVDLFAYDAGTDDGTNFLSDNIDVPVHNPISLLVGSSLDNEPALGTFTITLIPEPASFALMGVLGGLGLLSRKR